MSEPLVVNEIFLSLQGESSFAGLPCIFVRLTGCDLRCSYCDTAYAFAEGRKMTTGEIRAEIDRLARPFAQTGPGPGPSAGPMPLPRRWPILEVTGGEPLLQRGCLGLMQKLCDEGFTVLIETNGAHDISGIDRRVHRIMDLKCPSSGEADRMRWENIASLSQSDEVKFVIGSVQDYEWARERISRYNLAAICPVLVSWVEPLSLEQQAASLRPRPAAQTPLSRRELAERIMGDALPVRFQVQMHKIIWPHQLRGV